MHQSICTASWRFCLPGVLALLVVAAPRPALPFTVLQNNQSVNIGSNAFNQALIFNFETGATQLSSVGNGSRVISYSLGPAPTLEDAHFVGVFMYDFSLGRFTTSFYALGANTTATATDGDIGS